MMIGERKIMSHPHHLLGNEITYLLTLFLTEQFGLFSVYGEEEEEILENFVNIL